jgi:proton glutamate symport protein
MDVLMLLRWLAIIALVVFVARRRSLTAWILLSMVIGAEVGHDFQSVAVELRFLSQIFLRLITTIVAPLLFATLVVGIAGHSNLRQVGRMGVRALIYFEVVTTFALLIGWVAISISRAGEGIVLPPPTEGTQIPQRGATYLAGHPDSDLSAEHRPCGRRRPDAADRRVQRHLRDRVGDAR